METLHLSLNSLPESRRLRVFHLICYLTARTNLIIADTSPSPLLDCFISRIWRGRWSSSLFPYRREEKGDGQMPSSFWCSPSTWGGQLLVSFFSRRGGNSPYVFFSKQILPPFCSRFPFDCGFPSWHLNLNFVYNDFILVDGHGCVNSRVITVWPRPTSWHKLSKKKAR